MARGDSSTLKELRERNEYAEDRWQVSRREGAKDMRYVGGDPWDADDKRERKNRATVAPEEMGQYFNQVINPLRGQPRGMKFTPNGNGATDAGARFYQNKARETEYRSHAQVAYITAAENAIQRSYGFLRLELRYQSPRSANQEIWIEGFPDPDMVLPDPDAKRPDSSDMRYCFVKEWLDEDEFKREHPKAKVKNFDSYGPTNQAWISGNRIQRAEYWTIETRERRLLLVQPPAPRMMRGAPPARPIEVFEDEFLKMPIPGATVVRELRMVDYPDVWMYLTNGIEILHEQQWPGKYIPIVSCYGKIIYVPDGSGESKRHLLSMTRFGRDPWKSYCYACSQELEILGQVPKSAVIAAEGQLAGHETEWEEAPHVPKAFLLYKAQVSTLGDQLLPPPQRLAYLQSDNLQALEVVKEGMRRAIQSAMGSNFLPTQAQKRNEKSGVALDKINQSASTGTFHFVDNYDGMIRQVAVIFEDLCDKVYDYQGETSVMEDQNTSKQVPINDPSNKDAIDTRGDYLVTVSTGPSSDSERDSVEDFLDTLVQNLQEIAAIAGPQAAKKLMAQSIRMRNGGVQMDQIADTIDPPAPMGQDGKPMPPELQAAQAQIQQLQQQLQQAMQAVHGKVIEQQGKQQITETQEAHADERNRQNNEVKLAVAELSAKVERMALFLDERARVGAQIHDATLSAQQLAHDATTTRHASAHDAIEKAKDRVHERAQTQAAVAAGAMQSAQDHAQGLETQEQAASLAPDPAE